MDWLVHFPKYGNKGKYLNYAVIFIDRKKGMKQPGKLLKLIDILENPKFEDCYPHTVGYYKEAFMEEEFKPEYLELRKIDTIEDFWLFLNALDI